jgi:soluble lytic murein transglycosylase
MTGLTRFLISIGIAAMALCCASDARCTWRARADSLRREADSYYEARDYRSAAENYRSALAALESGAGAETNPYFVAKAARARFLLARSLESLEMWGEATSSYLQCLEELPEVSDYIHLRIAACYAGRGDYGAAISELRVVIEDEDETDYDSRAILDMAGYYEEDGNLDVALQWYRVYLGRAVSYNERALAHLRTGMVYETRGDTEAATRSYEKVVREFPRSPHAHDALERGRRISRAFTDRYSQGLVLYNRSLYSDASEFFSWYLRHDDDLAHVHEASYFLGRSHQRLGNFRTAASAYEDAIESGPGAEYFDLAWSKLAYCYRAVGHRERSIETYDRFLELYPERDAVSDLLWEKSRFLEERRRLDEAAESYSEFARLRPRSARADDAVFRSGLCLFKLGRHGSAESLFASAGLAAEGEAAARALFWAGKCREAQRGFGDAADRYAEAVLAAPDTYYGIRAAVKLRERGLPAPVRLPTLAGGRGAAPVGSEGNGGEGHAGVWGSDALEFASWLAEWYDRVYLPAGRAALWRQISSRSEFIRADTFLALRMRDEALRELDLLETAVGDDPRALDLVIDYCERKGLHKRGIRLAERILGMSPASGISEAPAYLARKICPAHFRDIVESECGLRALDPNIEYSLIRQESLFEPGAVSWVGARGLSQIMPATGRWIADRLDRRGYVRSQLFDPATNVCFGTEYLAVQLEEFDGDIFRALAAYNGGPDGATRWWDYGGGIDSDVFVEDIGYAQTSDYVRRVYMYSEYYRALYGG